MCHLISFNVQTLTLSKTHPDIAKKTIDQVLNVMETIAVIPVETEILVDRTRRSANFHQEQKERLKPVIIQSGLHANGTKK